VAAAAAGNDLIVEHIIEFRAWRESLATLLDGLDVFLVGVHCDLAEIDRRERDRGDRRIGEGRSHVETDLIHTFGPYDFEVHTTNAVPPLCQTPVRHVTCESFEAKQGETGRSRQ
jgi:chloramphenicol 3-O phosphotransferase